MCKVQKTIVNRVKTLCKERNLSYYMLAHQSGVPTTTMFHLVDGTTQSTRIITIVKICSGLGMTLEEFFGTSEFEELLQVVSEED